MHCADIFPIAPLEINESEQSDAADRAEADQAFDLLKNWIDSHKDELEDRLTRSTALGGCWVLQAKWLGSEYDDLLIALAPLLGKRGGFGHAGHRPLIMLAALKAPYDLRYIDTRITGMRDIFLHEFMHFLAWSRNTRPSKTSADVLGDDSDRTEYYNHPEELNAHYQEGVSGFARLVRNVIKMGHRDTAMEMWGSKSTHDLVRDVMSRHLEREFVDHLVPSNRRKIEKRVARFIEQTIRPMFAAGNRHDSGAAGDLSHSVAM